MLRSHLLVLTEVNLSSVFKGYRRGERTDNTLSDKPSFLRKSAQINKHRFFCHRGADGKHLIIWTKNKAKGWRLRDITGQKRIFDLLGYYAVQEKETTQSHLHTSVLTHSKIFLILTTTGKLILYGDEGCTCINLIQLHTFPDMLEFGDITINTLPWILVLCNAAWNNHSEQRHTSLITKKYFLAWFQWLPTVPFQYLIQVQSIKKKAAFFFSVDKPRIQWKHTEKVFPVSSTDCILLTHNWKKT